MHTNEQKQHHVPLYGTAEVRAGNNGSGFLCKALTRTISLSGVGLYTHDPLEVGAHVSIIIRFTQRNGIRPADIVEGVVISVSEMESFYCVDVRFNSKLNIQDQPNLYTHLVSGEK